MSTYLNDHYEWGTSRKILTKEYLDLPSLHMIGCATYRKVYAPLDTHYHNTMEIVVIIKGRQSYIVNDTQYTLGGGDVFITYPGEIHGNGLLPQSVCEFIWFQLLQSAWKHMIQKDRASKLLAHSNLREFIILLFCFQKASGNQRVIDPDIRNALAYIQAHLTEPINISDIAEGCCLSESTLKEKFKRQAGVSPINYVNFLKIEKAKELLKNTDASVTDIAFSLSFSTSNYFSTVFKNFTGWSPSEFRSMEKK